MATCKNCIHHKACSADRKNDKYFMLIGCVNVETSCIDFADKQNFVEVVHGRWEEDEPPKHFFFTGVDVIYRCSECNNRFVHDTKYCPNCGAKMDGGNDDAER